MRTRCYDGTTYRLYVAAYGSSPTASITSSLRFWAICDRQNSTSTDTKKLFTYVRNFKEYDELLEKNIAFIDLYDSAANNTVLECIVRNTPLIVNRTPGVVEYLGEDYPLYFDNLEEVDSLLDLEKLKSGHEYLKNMYKEDITMEHFFDKFIKVIYMYSYN